MFPFSLLCYLKKITATSKNFYPSFWAGAAENHDRWFVQGEYHHGVVGHPLGQTFWQNDENY